MSRERFLRRAKIEKYSGLLIRSHKLVPPLRSGKHFVVDIPIGGDAPKDFIKVYRYGECRAANRNSWIAYIAKVGHKWYPNESITEHLLTRIGQISGVRVADSCLMRADGQIRFLSRFFLKSEESLIHGAQIFSGYLEDPTFVQSIVEERLSHEMFTFQFIKQAISAQFPLESDKLMIDFVRLLAYDAIVGNNDRHHLNWGVVQKSLSLQSSVEFSPVFDTARSFFWNHSDKRIRQIVQNPHRKQKFLKKYIYGSKPKTGWDNKTEINHFQLIKNIIAEFPEYTDTLQQIGKDISVQAVEELLETEFKRLMISERRHLIVECLKQRLHHYNQIVGKEMSC